MLLVNWDDDAIKKLFEIPHDQADKLIKQVFSDLSARLKPFHGVCVNDGPEVKMLVDESAITDVEGYRVVSKLSADERSTVIFPLVTHGVPYPLIIDQIEDYLD